MLSPQNQLTGKCLFVLAFSVLFWLVQECSSDAFASAGQITVYGVAKCKCNSASSLEQAVLTAELNTDQLVALATGVELSVARATDGGLTCAANSRFAARGVVHEAVYIRKDYKIVKITLDRSTAQQDGEEGKKLTILRVKGDAAFAHLEIVRAIQAELVRRDYKGEKILARLDRIKFDLNAALPTFNAGVSLSVRE